MNAKEEGAEYKVEEDLQNTASYRCATDPMKPHQINPSRGEKEHCRSQYKRRRQNRDLFKRRGPDKERESGKMEKKSAARSAKGTRRNKRKKLPGGPKELYAEVIGREQVGRYVKKQF